MNWQDFIFIFNGIMTTVTYSFLSVFFGFLLALPIVALSLSHHLILSSLGNFYISLIRGVPLILQLSFWYFALSKTALHFSTFSAAIIAFAINSSAYLAEILRSALESLDKGQLEAANVLGISKKDALLDILLPQAMRNISPSLMNEIVTMVKESAIVGIIGVQDLMKRAQLVTAAQYDFFMPLITAGCLYYLLGIGMTSLYDFISKNYWKKMRN